MQEHRTAEFIEAALDRLGIEHFRCGGTGVVGLQRNGDGPVVAFRADIDGLPIEEQTGAEFRSEARGTLPDGTEVPVMHGCGHDSHTAAALAACGVFERDRAGWSGTIVWIFQPGEETAAGANAMVADGLWDRAPRPAVVLGQHVVPAVPAGSVALCEGPAMAAADALKVTIHGKQSHGSQPQDSIDPIVLGAFIVTRLQTIVAREIAPQSAAVVTCGTFHAGVKENIIPDRAELTLNTRTLTDEVRDALIPAIRRVISAEAAASGAPEPEVEELYRFPALVNDAEQARVVRAGIAAELGAERVLTVGPGMGSEDFGGLATSIGVPNVYWFFGAYAADATEQPVNHSPQFLPDGELPLVTGARAAIGGIRAALGETREA
ncbi:amidohydrolase [Leucobacter sp. CSA2]|uniref:Amidohydrolase n=2 Tax=Leucobacter edaphi TaxID=2796472 RepID=A0A934QCS9_9MICO|nr:amidohydrolase [Leucobacter edaphi]